MKKILCVVLVVLFLAVVVHATDFTVSQGEFLDWTALDDTVSDLPYVTTGEESIPEGAVGIRLHIVVAHKDANAAASNYVFVEVSVQAGGNGNDEDWRRVARTTMGGGTATGVSLNANSGASQANPERLEVASTAAWDTGQGENVFLVDTSTLANSCLAKIGGWSDNDYYVCVWGLERDYDSADALYDKVEFFQVDLPPGADKCRVDFTNSDDDATYAVKVDYTCVTDVE